jgi:hypothetical protein
MRVSRSSLEQRKEKAVMTEFEPQGRDTQHVDEPRNTFWGHSLAGVAICLGTGAAIALIAIFG